MTSYILRRFLQMFIVLFLVTLAVFFLTTLLPGDPALAILGEERAGDRVLYEALRKELGLDRPLHERYLSWLWGVVRGDLGRSIRTKEPVWESLLYRLPVTVQLGVQSILLSLMIGIPLGILAAVKPNTAIDSAATTLGLASVAMPTFWQAIIFIYIFSVGLRWLPPGGYVAPWEDLAGNLRVMLMPTVCVGTTQAAVIMRQTRASILEVMAEDYITTARSKGLSEGRVVTGHALKNALLPVITIVGVQLGNVIAGTVIVETVFALPGIGRFLVSAINRRDFPEIQGVVLIVAFAVVVANIVTDIVYSYLDPRIRYE